MLPSFIIFLSFYLSYSLGKVTYFNLETTYGPYCNPNNMFTPEAGIVRYAGTPWIGRCQLNLQSCCLPNLNITSNPTIDIPLSTKFYVHLLKPPLCSTEIVVIYPKLGDTVTIDCNTTIGSEYYFDTEQLTIEYNRTAKLPLSKFSMIVTPLKLKTRTFVPCGFDCFTDTYCIDRSLICDRYQNCPNNVDEAQCEYSQQHAPLSTRSKMILLFSLVIIISVAISIILICYFCCGISNQSRLMLIKKEQQLSLENVDEVGVALKPLLPWSPTKQIPPKKTKTSSSIRR